MREGTPAGRGGGAVTGEEPVFPLSLDYICMCLELRVVIVMYVPGAFKELVLIVSINYFGK